MKEYFEKLYKDSKENFKNILDECLLNGKKYFIITANPETFMMSNENEELRNALLNKESVIVADGIGIVKGAKILNYNIKETITGVELCTALLEKCNKYGKSIYFFGAKQDVLHKLLEVVKIEYPNIIISGFTNGYVDNKNKVFDEIYSLQPDVCFVALGIPMQEILINNNFARFNKGIFMGVGGSFDVISGIKKRAPKIFVNTHTEWLYRITKEPKRLKRFFKYNIKYLFKLKYLK